MDVKSTNITGLKLIDPAKYSDDRGWMSELWNATVCPRLGSEISFVQDSMAYNRDAGTIRGLHFQAPPFDQGKLVICVSGSIFDVALDLRTGSPTFGNHFSVTLDSKATLQLWIPSGFAHGYCSLEPHSKVLYKLTKPYERDAAAGILWNDPNLNISWPVQPKSVVINKRDEQWPSFANFDSPFR